MSEKLVLSYSRAETWLRCRQRYHWIYHENLTPIGFNPNTALGDVVHRVLARFHDGNLATEDLGTLDQKVQEWHPNITEAEAYDLALAAASLFHTYYKEFGTDDEYQPEGSEIHLVKDFGEFKLYSRYDTLYRGKDKRLWRGEHKTVKRIDVPWLGGIKNRLQTGIALWLADELLEERLSGTIFNLLVKTQVPQAKRQMDLRSRWIVDFVKCMIPKIAKEIQEGNIYPSMDCFKYNKDCGFQPLCHSDTPATREALYTNREEVKQRSRKPW